MGGASLGPGVDPSLDGRVSTPPGWGGWALHSFIEARCHPFTYCLLLVYLRVYPGAGTVTRMGDLDKYRLRRNQ